MSRRLRNPKREEKFIMSRNHLMWEDWFIDDNTELEEHIKCVNKTTGERKILSKHSHR